MINTRPRTWLLAGAASLAMSFGCFVRADVTGTAKLDGTAPEQKPIDMSAVAECNNLHPDPVTEENVVVNDKGMLRYVVVSVKKEDSPDLPAGEMSKEPAVIDQKGCMYSPHVQAMMVGQELKINNSDPFLHNIHSLATTNPGFNKAQSNKTPEPEKAPEQPKAAEYIRFKCDVHPWMSSCLAVFDHPYFGVSDENGKFTIKNVPDGDYTIHAWHEKLGEQDQKVSVKGGKGEVNFTFKPEGAQAPAVSNVILASDHGGPSKSCCDGMQKVEKVAASK